MSNRQYELDVEAYGSLVADALAVAQRHSQNSQWRGADAVLRDAIDAAAAGRRLPGQGPTLTSEELRDWREDMGWSQTQMATALRGVLGRYGYPTMRTYQNIEAGRQPMPTGIESALARLRDCG
jgi:hypothetical protein